MFAFVLKSAEENLKRIADVGIVVIVLRVVVSIVGSVALVLIAVTVSRAFHAVPVAYVMKLKSLTKYTSQGDRN